jgi:hypothetical protein
MRRHILLGAKEKYKQFDFSRRNSLRLTISVCSSYSEDRIVTFYVVTMSEMS